MEKLVWVRTGGNDHGSICGAAKNSFIEGNIGRSIVVNLVNAAIGIFKFVFSVNDAGLCAVETSLCLLFHEMCKLKKS
jgi:hypothetical protein